MSAEVSPRVVHLSSVHPPFDVRIFHKECRSIAKAGYDVTLVVCHDRSETKDGVRLEAIPRHSARISRMIRTVWAAYRKSRQQDAGLYQFHDPELIPVGLLLQLLGKRVVYDVHEDVASDILSKYYIPRWLRRPLAWLLAFIETVSSRFFSAVVTATVPISDRFRSRNEHTVVISNYPILEEGRAPNAREWPQRSCSVAYVGVLARDRCLAEMVQAMALLSENYRVTLKLAGAFSPKSLIEGMARLGGWDRVAVLGILGQGQIAELLADVRAGLVILQPTPSFLRSAPTKMFEYMAAGIPVIASDFPGFREIVEEAGCGLLVDPLNPRAIADAIEFILDNPSEAEQMGRRGRAVVEARYNWASEERKLLDLYKSLLETPKPPCVA